MSLLKWKQLAESRSELGKKINTVREIMKQRTISDQMGEVEAEKLFKPITSELREIAAPKMPLRGLPKKKKKVPVVPDYGIAIEDEVPDYGLEDLFSDQVLPQGEKQIYKDPDYEEEGPDYNILKEDTINQVLDKFEIPNYEEVELRLKEEDMNNEKSKDYLNQIIQNAYTIKQQFPEFLFDVDEQLNSGLITEDDAQYRIKVVKDAINIFNDYIKYYEKRLNDIKGSGLKKKTKKGGQVMFLNNPTEMMKKLELIIGSMVAGNNSIELRNTGVAILDILLKNSNFNSPQYNKIYKNYFM